MTREPLRTALIEAMSGIDQLDEDFKEMMAKTPSGGEPLRQFMRDDAELKLDRLLDALADHADEWVLMHGERNDLLRDHVLDLITVLRTSND